MEGILIRRRGELFGDQDEGMLAMRAISRAMAAGAMT